MRFTHITKIIVALLSITTLIIVEPHTLNAVTVADGEPTVTCNTSMEIKTYAKCMVVEKWGYNHWDSFDFIIFKESSWNYKAANPVSTARGLCQTMMSLHGPDVDEDFLLNPYKQIDWCIDYADSRYGSPNKAKVFWDNNKWW